MNRYDKKLIKYAIGGLIIFESLYALAGAVDGRPANGLGFTPSHGRHGNGLDTTVEEAIDQTIDFVNFMGIPGSTVGYYINDLLTK